MAILSSVHSVIVSFKFSAKLMARNDDKTMPAQMVANSSPDIAMPESFVSTEVLAELPRLKFFINFDDEIDEIDPKKIANRIISIENCK